MKKKFTLTRKAVRFSLTNTFMPNHYEFIVSINVVILIYPLDVHIYIFANKALQLTQHSFLYSCRVCIYTIHTLE